MAEKLTISCSKEIGRWTIRINGMFIVDFWREATARRVAMAAEQE